MQRSLGQAGKHLCFVLVTKRSPAHIVGPVIPLVQQVCPELPEDSFRFLLLGGSRGLLRVFGPFRVSYRITQYGLFGGITSQIFGPFLDISHPRLHWAAKLHNGQTYSIQSRP